MQPVFALILTLLISLVPAALFLGLFKGLRRMQSHAIVSDVDDRMGDSEVKEVSISEAANSVFQRDSFLPSTSSKTQLANTCGVCGSRNDSVASYCQSCTSKL